MRWTKQDDGTAVELANRATSGDTEAAWGLARHLTPIVSWEIRRATDRLRLSAVDADELAESAIEVAYRTVQKLAPATAEQVVGRARMDARASVTRWAERQAAPLPQGEQVRAARATRRHRARVALGIKASPGRVTVSARVATEPNRMVTLVRYGLSPVETAATSADGAGEKLADAVDALEGARSRGLTDAQAERQLGMLPGAAQEIDAWLGRPVMVQAA